MAQVTGGKKLDKILFDAKHARGVESVEVGFFATAAYDDADGTKVASVAARHEFGVGVPERPFIRPANKKVLKPLKRFLWKAMDPKKLVITEAMATDVGQMIQNAYQREITELRTPPNSPRTIARKGSSNPLVDSSLMWTSVTYKINR